jgi:23S rRNA (cytidine1920-2'-O)/16S rRNA (cytidine1409-2'-O)-methyltransferase
MKIRLDKALAEYKLVSTRSQAESFIRLGKVFVNNEAIHKPGYLVYPDDHIEVKVDSQYVSRAAYKLESVAELFKLDFTNKIILDVGSSTGGFTDYALQHGAKKVICVEVGTDQLHAKLRGDKRIELHEKTDIRSIRANEIDIADIVVIDVSFISLAEVLPHISSLIGAKTLVVAMAKPQFEAGVRLKNKGVIKNERMRRDILTELEQKIRKVYVVMYKADSGVTREKGNQERFYLLKKAKSS